MNAVIYARFSSHSQTEQSIEGQLHDCYAYAKRYDINIVGEYIDRAISGTTDDRPDFQRMIADAARRRQKAVRAHNRVEAGQVCAQPIRQRPVQA